MPRALVTEAGWDDIGQLLSQMNVDYENITCKSLEIVLKDRIRGRWGFDVLFVNCSTESSEFPWREVSSELQDFVSNGGYIYASDLSASLIDQVFPGFLEFSTVGVTQGRHEGEIIDEGLRTTLGHMLNVHYDSVVVAVYNVSSNVKVYVRRRQGRRTDNILTSFKVGDGEVIYTTFHNHVQASSEEQELLRFLALRPLLGRTAQTSLRTLERDGFASQTQIFGSTIMSQRRSYSYDATPGEPIRFILNWQETNSLELSVYSPDNKLFRSERSNSPPITISVDDPVKGKWTYNVRSLTGNSSPFVADVALGTRIWQRENDQNRQVLNKGRFCRHCGGSISNEAKFCRRCGKLLLVASSSA